MNRSGSIPGKNSGIVLSPSEAEEYCEFKRQKRIAEVVTALTKSELYAAGRDIFPAEIKKIADSAKRVGSAAVRVSPMYVLSLIHIFQARAQRSRGAAGRGARRGAAYRGEEGGDGGALSRLREESSARFPLFKRVCACLLYTSADRTRALPRMM